MSESKTLIFFGAHPDDETFGIGGTLAHYASAGVKVYYACATRGEAGFAAPEYMKGYTTVGDMRWAELECAAKVLGLAGVIYLGYRDSGMPGAADNKHPQALAAAPVEEVASRVVKVMRELKPQVVITSDPHGGYGHPDHIAVHKATVKAFQAAGDATQYTEAGPAFQPQKLYFAVRSSRFFRFMVRLMPLFGQDPHHMGRNKDIDMASILQSGFPAHASVHLRKQDKRLREEASACYASQGGGRPRPGLLGLAFRLSGRRDLYMRAYPAPTNRRKGRDLFEEIA